MINSEENFENKHIIKQDMMYKFKIKQFDNCLNIQDDFELNFNIDDDKVICKKIKF